MEHTPPMDSGRTYQARSVPIREQTSEKSSKRSSMNAVDTPTIMFLNLKNGNVPEQWSETDGQ